jgi:hypothetical protein
MDFCSICRRKVAGYVCRRCGRKVCKDCYFHHGVCVECARFLGKQHSFRRIIGGIIGNFIWPHTAVLAVFTWVPGILGALASGIIVKGEKSHLWTFALAVHATLISAFYLHPVGNTVALWALYDKVIALALIFPTVKIVKKSRISEGESLDVKWLLPALALTSFIGTEADDITGNVIFMYLELYKLFGIPPEALPPLYVAGAVIMPLQRVLVAIIATLVAVPLFKAFEKSALIRWPLT